MDFDQIQRKRRHIFYAMQRRAGIRTALLLSMDGANGSTSFVDRGPNSFSVTPFGAAQISTAQSKFGGASGSFSGTFNATTGQSGLTVPNSPYFDFGSGDFTIEAFVRLDALTTVVAVSHSILCKRATTAVFAPFNLEIVYISGNTRLRGQVSTSGAAWITCLSTTNLAINTWYHVALCRAGDNLRLYLDGVQQGATQSVVGALMTNSDAVSIGAASVARDYGLDGFLDEVRVTKGKALYTTNFAPPSQAF